MFNAYVPAYSKRSLLEWMINKFPNTPKSKFHRMNKSQLWAIYFKTTRKGR